MLTPHVTEITRLSPHRSEPLLIKATRQVLTTPTAAAPVPAAADK
jgi:hypothetical protein